MHHYLQLYDLHFAYKGGDDVLRGISFRIEHGQHVALAGANGAGKSTLLLHINGLLQPTRGSIDVGGILLTDKTEAIIRQSVGMVFQDSDNQLFMPSVEEDVAFGPAAMGLTREEVTRRVEKSLSEVDALHLREREPHSLSGGEKKRVAIATVLAMTPSILVLDEPTVGLDPRSRRQIIALLRQFRHTMLIATHDMDLIDELCERTIVLNRGKVAADAPTAEVFSNMTLLDECELEQPSSMRFMKSSTQIIPPLDRAQHTDSNANAHGRLEEA
ncbi:MAG: ABC transporter ATP-binding protein [Alistipes sp.]|nr:ABC transporter ATP-binding protein [Alistipes sp.]